MDEDGLELVCAIDPAAGGRPLAQCADLGDSPLVIASDLEAAVDAHAEVLVDFTVADVARNTLQFGAAHGMHIVCGTTGLDASDLVDLAKEFEPLDRPNAIVAPNFAISAVLMMRLADLAAPYFDNAEIIELHHDQKRDAPSGTAVESARRIARRREETETGDFGADPTEREVIVGARGAKGPANINLHSVRLRGLVAHQEIIFGAPGQSLTIRQDSYDRTSFMPGVLLAISKVARTPGFTLGLDQLLDL
jgi:4-hydroxy-tetrahydrodipicolinate reductase